MSWNTEFVAPRKADAHEIIKRTASQYPLAVAETIRWALSSLPEPTDGKAIYVKSCGHIHESEPKSTEERNRLRNVEGTFTLEVKFIAVPEPRPW